MDSFNRAIGLSPNLAYAYFGRGYTLTMWNRHREAIADFEMAERLSPADPLLWVNYDVRAWAFLNLGELDDTIHWAEKSAGMPDSTVWPYFNLTMAHYMKGDLKSSQRAREILSTMQPKFSIAFLKKAAPMADSDTVRSLFDKMIEAGIPEQ